MVERLAVEQVALELHRLAGKQEQPQLARKALAEFLDPGILAAGQNRPERLERVGRADARRRPQEGRAGAYAIQEAVPARERISTGTTVRWREELSNSLLLSQEALGIAADEG
ncbi:MAG: hypothetical protein WCO90_07360, partial [Planctomycetota bacterium]